MQINISKIVKQPSTNFRIDKRVSYWVTVDIFTKEEQRESMSVNVFIDDEEDLFLTKDIEAMALQKTKQLLNKAFSSIKTP